MTFSGYKPGELPDKTSTTVPETGGPHEPAVGVVLGPREWDSLSGRTKIEWEQDGRRTVIRRSDGRGVMLSEDLTVVEVHLDHDAISALSEQGVVSWVAGADEQGPPVTVVRRDG